MNDFCDACGSEIAAGMRVFQLSKGNFYIQAETPTYARGGAVLLETHAKCRPDIPLAAQYRPYSCLYCEQTIGHGNLVVYAYFGNKPSAPYFRPESRGHRIPFIVHDECWEEGNYEDLVDIGL